MRTLRSLSLFLLLVGCVDRLQFDIEKPLDYGISISGFISDQPGPYSITINKAFDIESKEDLKTPVSVKRVLLYDNQGTSEELNEVSAGTYQTSANGIRGKAGNVYTLRIELLDGSIYESVPDTLLPAGQMDSLYYSFTGEPNEEGTISYGFDILYNASGGDSDARSFMWSMTGTYRIDSHPELDVNNNCYMLDGKCNFVPPCSGIRNLGPNSVWHFAILERVYSCECCTCWYSIFNKQPMLSDNAFAKKISVTNAKIDRIPLSGWTFMYKVYIEVSQRSLTNNAYRFWKSIRNQQEGVGSLFQPVIGKIPVNFTQLSGTSVPIQGLFYATGISSKTLYITRSDIPDENMIPAVNKEFGNASCLILFPNATTVRPSFWVD